MKWVVRSNQEFCLSGKTNKDNFLPLHRGTRGQSSLRDLLQPLVEGVLNDKNLSINTNPLEVYKAWINQMESETGEARYECIIVCLHRDKLLVACLYLVCQVREFTVREKYLTVYIIL